jgi:hypothetical protein
MRLCPRLYIVAANKYDDKLAITGTFEELIKVSVNYTPPKKEPAKKPAKKKK